MPVEVPIPTLVKPFLGVGRKFVMAAAAPVVATIVTILLVKALGLPVDEAAKYAKEFVLIPTASFIGVETVLDYRNGRK